MLTSFHHSNFDDFHKNLQSSLKDNDNKEILTKKITDSFEIFPQEDSKGIPSPSISLEFLDDNSFSDALSLPSTSASSSFDSLPFSPPHKSQVYNGSLDWVDKRKKKRKCVLQLWSQYGTCKYGEECAFAHGYEEIREKIHIASNYKSRKCWQFHENGYCVYGPRCHFIHSLTEDAKKNPPSLLDNSYEKDLNNVGVWFNQNNDCVCTQRINRIRLPCFPKLAAC